MPIIWRYLISHFLTITVACVLAFIAILLTMRLDEIAHFAVLGAPLTAILLFTFHQTFYILPIAIPLSCLIASFILIQRLSKSHELTALRACGFALRDIISPVLLTAILLSILNFWIISELATNSHLQTNMLKSELRSVNPLLLLHNKHLMRMKGFYFDALGPSKVGEFASDVVLAIPSKHQQRLNLFIAKEVKSSEETFNGQQVTLITSLSSASDDKYDDLLVENFQESINQVTDFSRLLQKKVWTINNDYLQLPLLLVRAEEQKQAIKLAKANKINRAEVKKLSAQLNRSLSEITKRFSIALAVFSFTLMGTAFGISISREKSYRSLFAAIFLTAVYLIAFFVAKGVDHNRILANILYLAPHALIIFASIFVLVRANKGIE